MKIIVTGSRGMLGLDLVPRLEQAGFQVMGVDIDELDITRLDDISRYFKMDRPGLVINCAAYTAVDRAEKESDSAFAVNRDGPDNLARVCMDRKLPLVHISTDYVFDGNGDQPYPEDDPVNPLGIYGKSKWEGEEAVRTCLKENLIIRTAWLFGVHGKNFVKTMINLSCEREEFNVVSDQIGCPTWSGDLSDALVYITKVIQKNRARVPWGTYHFCGQGQTSWHGFACAVVEETSKRGKSQRPRFQPIPTCDYPTPAKRPMWSVMDCCKIQNASNVHPLYWRDGLVKMLERLYYDAGKDDDPGGSD
ncbi:MAG: dTDP-4-dehydrorhamnose reductase [Deltaproteobacteria bacterium]|nr:dTDP-4-dehydrorhamnose reductase [Deltaproteobacteria bacterium]